MDMNHESYVSFGIYAIRWKWNMLTHIHARTQSGIQTKVMCIYGDFWQLNKTKQPIYTEAALDMEKKNIYVNEWTTDSFFSYKNGNVLIQNIRFINA